jgi:hypothetical protein
MTISLYQRRIAVLLSCAEQSGVVGAAEPVRQRARAGSEKPALPRLCRLNLS